MEAIKKKIASLKQEMDLANEKYETNEVKAKAENFRADQIYDEVRDLEKKLVQMEKDFVTSKSTLEIQTAELERCEKAYAKAEQDRSILTKRATDMESLLIKKEELRLSATIKLARATELNDDARRMCNVLEERSKLDEVRIEKLTNELKDARLLAEDADQKSEDSSTKLSLAEEAAESADERMKSNDAKIIEREDELFIVQNIVKSLVVSEEKANARVADMKEQLKELKKMLKETEKRAILAERTVKKLIKEVDFKEDELREEKEKYKALCDDLDLTFSELTGF